MLDVLSTGPGEVLLLAIVAIGAIALVVIATLLAAVWKRSGETSNEVRDLQEAVAGLQADQRHYLTARNLGPLHEKINDVGKEVAAMRAEQRSTTEQLRIINRHLMNLS